MESQHTDWHSSNSHSFWGEIAPHDHIVQVYESERNFLDTLEGFVGSGLLTGDTVVVIATAEHLLSLNSRINQQGLKPEDYIGKGKYIPLNARDTLNKFIVKDWPDEKLFFKTVGTIFKKARKGNSRVRAFGEMVALLWQDGNYAATVHLEHLWNKFCATQEFCLYCAYPKSGFTKDPAVSIKEICCTHSKVISGVDMPSTEIRYRHVEQGQVHFGSKISAQDRNA